MSTQREMDEAAVRQHLGKIVEGLRSRDLDALARLYATDVVSFDIEPPLRHVGIDAKLANWRAVFATFTTADYEVRDLAVTVGDGMAFGHAFARLSGRRHDGTATDGMWVRITYCLRRTDGAWLITHDHVSVPLDAASGRAATDLGP